MLAFMFAANISVTAAGLFLIGWLWRTDRSIVDGRPYAVALAVVTAPFAAVMWAIPLQIAGVL